MMSEARWNRRRPKALSNGGGKGFSANQATPLWHQLDKGMGLCYKNSAFFRWLRKQVLIFVLSGIDKTIAHDISFIQ
jgi:hypothetical protein